MAQGKLDAAAAAIRRELEEAREPQQPIHDRGVITSQPGLYFVGLHFQYSLASETILGH